MRGALLLAVGLGATAGAAAVELWHERNFDQNLAACQSTTRPEWCAEWFAAIDISRPKSTDLSLPEWHRLTFPYAAGLCVGLLPPGWCGDWLEAMRQVAAGSVYGAIIAKRKAGVDAVAAERQAATEDWQGVLGRIRTRTMRPEDLRAVRERAGRGDGEALELLGWMHTKGYGVDMNFLRAYESYGAALLAGRQQVKANLDAIWPYLNEAEKRRMVQQFGSATRPDGKP